MKLSKAIVEGSKKTTQAFGTFYGKENPMAINDKSTVVMTNGKEFELQKDSYYYMDPKTECFMFFSPTNEESPFLVAPRENICWITSPENE